MNHKIIFIKKTPLNLIKNNLKKIEIRQFKGFNTTLKENDQIQFKSSTQTYQTQIKKILLFENLKILLENTQLNLINPNFHNIQDAIKHYKQYYNNLNNTFLAIYI